MCTLVIDVGNTRTSFGLYAQGAIQQTGHLEKGEPALPDFFEGQRLEKIVLASVVPERTRTLCQQLEAKGLPRPLIVGPELELGVPIDYPDPASIGADRLANAAAAARLTTLPAVVCDFGTALTFDILHAQRGYIGGIICPGLPLMFDYLAEKTALLPHISPVKTTACVGRNTQEAMQIGARIGYRGMVREILFSLKKELGEPLSILCTGGYAGWIFEGWDVDAQILPQLTLLGLGIIGELNPVPAT